jgi:serine/threonine protein kinase
VAADPLLSWLVQKGALSAEGAHWVDAEFTRLSAAGQPAKVTDLIVQRKLMVPGSLERAMQIYLQESFGDQVLIPPPTPPAAPAAGDTAEYKELLTPEATTEFTQVLKPGETGPSDPFLKWLVGKQAFDVQAALGVEAEIRRLSTAGQSAQATDVIIQRKLMVASSMRRALQLYRQETANGPTPTEQAPAVGEAVDVAELLARVRAGQQVKIGRYRVEGTLGSGSMGAVLRGYDERMDRPVALKVVSTDEKLQRRFAQEAKALALLNHDNVVRVYDFEQVGGLSLLVMDPVEGVPLDGWVKEHGVVSEEDAWQLLLQMARALEHAAEHDLIHRDVKPANVVCSQKPDGAFHAQLCDFGIAKIQTDADTLTPQGNTVGTPHYMSPEQALGHDLDVRSDMYSLGLTVYYALTGRVPFEGGPIAAVMAKRIREPAPDVCDERDDLSDALSQSLERLTNRNREDRPSTWSELVADIEAGSATSSRSGSGVERASTKGSGSGRRRLAKKGSSGSHRLRKKGSSGSHRLREKGSGASGRLRKGTGRTSGTGRSSGPPKAALVGVVAAFVLVAAVAGWATRGSNATSRDSADATTKIEPIAKAGPNDRPHDVEDKPRGTERDGPLSTETSGDDPDASHGPETTDRSGANSTEIATDEFTRILDSDPTRIDAFVGRSELRVQQGNFEGGLADAEAALELDEENALALNLKGLTLGGLERPQEALAAFNRAIKLHPRTAQLVWNRGELLLLLEQWERANTDYTTFIALLEADDMDTSIAIKLAAAGASIARAYFQRASSRYKNHDLKGARADFLKAEAAFVDEGNDSWELIARQRLATVDRALGEDADPTAGDDDDDASDTSTFPKEAKAALASLQHVMARAKTRLDESLAKPRKRLRGKLKKALDRAAGQGSLDKAMELRSLIEQLDAGQRTLISPPLTETQRKVAIKRGQEHRITAASPRGFELGPLPAGTTLVVKYLRGRWKAWGNQGTQSPDSEEQEREKECRLVVCNGEKPLQVVPAETANSPFAWTATEDCNDVLLRINDSDGDFGSNPAGDVVYRITSLSPAASQKLSSHLSTVTLGAIKRYDASVGKAVSRQSRTIRDERASVRKILEAEVKRTTKIGDLELALALRTKLREFGATSAGAEPTTRVWPRNPTRRDWSRLLGWWKKDDVSSSRFQELQLGFVQRRLDAKTLDGVARALKDPKRSQFAVEVLSSQMFTPQEQAPWWVKNYKRLRHGHALYSKPFPVAGDNILVLARTGTTRGTVLHGGNVRLEAGGAVKLEPLPDWLQTKAFLIRIRILVPKGSKDTSIRLTAGTGTWETKLRGEDWSLVLDGGVVKFPSFTDEWNEIVYRIQPKAGLPRDVLITANDKKLVSKGTLSGTLLQFEVHAGEGPVYLAAVDLEKLGS